MVDKTSMLIEGVDIVVYMYNSLFAYFGVVFPLFTNTSHNALLCFFSFVPSGKCDGR